MSIGQILAVLIAAGCFGFIGFIIWKSRRDNPRPPRDHNRWIS